MVEKLKSDWLQESCVGYYDPRLGSDFCRTAALCVLGREHVGTRPMLSPR
jgi:hypothetical protein